MTLKDLRKRADLTQEEVADALCVCQSAVSYWERGIAGVGKTKRKRMAQMFGCTVDELIEAIAETEKERSENGEGEAEL